MKSADGRESLTSGRVIIVEDDVEAAQMLGEQLATLGITPRLVHDGQQAILATGASRPHLVIMDLVMPMLDGLETSRYFKNRFADVGIPILILTAKDDSQSREQLAELGCDDFFVKPYQLDELDYSVKCLVALGLLQEQRFNLSSRPAAPKKRHFWQRGGSEDDAEQETKLEEVLDGICECHAQMVHSLAKRRLDQFLSYHIERIEQTRPNYAELDSLRALRAEQK